MSLFFGMLAVLFTGFGTDVNLKTSFLEPVNFFVGLHCVTLFVCCTGSLLTVGGLAIVFLSMLLLTNTYLFGLEPDTNLV